MSVTELLSSRSIVTALISSLKHEGSSSGTSTLPPSSKDGLLTLHVLFQNELLPALDLLDRGLVTRLRIALNGSNDILVRDEETGEQRLARLSQRRSSLGDPKGSDHVYYVRSAQLSASNNSSRFRNAANEQTTYYEVRLDAWNCSCPAFAFAAFPANIADNEQQPTNSAPSTESQTWSFGGLTQGENMPLCKHLLACTLVEHSSLFESMVEERTVSSEELAGWATGWGG
jgi:hypothetical protein